MVCMHISGVVCLKSMWREVGRGRGRVGVEGADADGGTRVHIFLFGGVASEELGSGDGCVWGKDWVCGWNGPWVGAFEGCFEDVGGGWGELMGMEILCRTLHQMKCEMQNAECMYQPIRLLFFANSDVFCSALTTEP